MNDSEVLPFSGLSPFNIGPVTVYLGNKALTAKVFENAWQHVKLFKAHADDEGRPTVDHAQWMSEGIAADDARRFPMGRSAKPLCAVWRNRLVGYVEARLRVYIPLYVEGLCRSPAAWSAYLTLRELRRRAAAGKEVALFDYDGYDHVKAGKSLARVVADPAKKMGHAFVLAALLEDRLLEVVRDAAALAGLEALPARDLPVDLALMGPARAAEELRTPGGSELVGGAVVYYRASFLNRLADRYYALFIPGGAAAVPWAWRTLVMFGKEVREKHQTAYYGDPGASYRYAGRDHVPLPWSDDPSGALGELLRLVRHVTGQPFNFVLMNLYDKMDSIGAHSDDEGDLVAGAGIFSVSLGRVRRFVLTPKGSAGARGLPVVQRLAHGSALWMAGLTQQAYKHEVPAERIPPAKKAAADPAPALRVNLTFRCVRARARAPELAGPATS